MLLSLYPTVVSYSLADGRIQHWRLLSTDESKEVRNSYAVVRCCVLQMLVCYCLLYTLIIYIFSNIDVTQMLCNFFYRRRDSFVETTYFFFSFALLLLRTVAVCLLAARVNDESKVSLRYMHSVPSTLYTVDVSCTATYFRQDHYVTIPNIYL